MIRTERVRRSLPLFINDAWPILEPSTEYLSNWHIDCMSEYLTAVNLGQIKRLIINIPPRYMKSLSASVMWPCWSWIEKPSLRWLFASYSASLSTKHSVDRRQVIQSTWYRDRWGHVYQLAGDQNIKTEYANTKRGHMLATSVGGTATGKGGDIIVVDDPHNPMQAESDALREAAIEFFDRTLTTRLDDKKKGAIVVIMQRLHDLDLTGHLLKQNQMAHLWNSNEEIAQTLANDKEYQEALAYRKKCEEENRPSEIKSIDRMLTLPTKKMLEEEKKQKELELLLRVSGATPMHEINENTVTNTISKLPLETSIPFGGNTWTHLCLPATAKKEVGIFFPLSGKTKIRKEGEVLWPEREGPVELAQVKVALGSYGYSGQYDQAPAPEGGGILQKQWWRYYSMMPSQKDVQLGVISIDCAFKDLITSDYACLQAWWKIGANKYLIDQVRGKWSFPLLVTQIRMFINKHQLCKARLIEDKANGSAVIQSLKDEISGIIPVDPQGGKITRAHAVSPQLEAGNFWLPDPRLQPWVDDFVLECAKFPKAENDDQVDCFTQAGMYMDTKQFSTWVAKIPWL